MNAILESDRPITPGIINTYVIRYFWLPLVHKKGQLNPL